MCAGPWRRSLQTYQGHRRSSSLFPFRTPAPHTPSFTPGGVFTLHRDMCRPIFITYSNKLSLFCAFVSSAVPGTQQILTPPVSSVRGSHRRVSRGAARDPAPMWPHRGQRATTQVRCARLNERIAMLGSTTGQPRQARSRAQGTPKPMPSL